MLSNDYIAYAIFAVGVFTFYMAVMHMVRSDQMQSRVRNAADASYMTESTEEVPPAFPQFCERVLSMLKIDITSQKELSLLLSRAGIISPYAVTYFLFFKWIMQPLILLIGLIMLLIVILAGVGDLSDLLQNLILVAAFLVIGANGANLYVKNRKKKRQKILLDSFPEMMDLLLVCIEAGLGLDAALNRVCKELRGMYPDIVSELDRTRLELTMLNDRVVALQNLSDRAEIVAFRTLVSALIQTEKFGTSLVDTLRVLSEEQRLTRIFNAEQKAARIPVLITIPLILFIMPAFIMIIIGPPIIKVHNQGGMFGGDKAR